MKFHVTFYQKPAAHEFADYATVPYLTDDLSWGELAEYFYTEPTVCDHKDEYAFAGHRLQPQYRKADNVTDLSLLVLDFDAGTPTIDETIANWQAQGVAFIIATSYRHTNEHHKYRLIVPLAEPIPASEYPQLWKWAHIKEPSIDRAPKSVANFFFSPAKSSEDAPYFCHVEDGAFLDWRTLDYSIIPKPEPKKIADPYIPKDKNDKRVSAYINGVLRNCCDAVANAQEGTGNITLLNRARTLGGYLHYGTLSEGEIADNLENATLGWTKHRNISKTIRQGIGYGASSPLYIPVSEPQRKASDNSVFDNAQEVSEEMEEEELPEFELNDSGMLHLFHTLGFSENHRYAYDVEKWYAWNGQIWTLDHQESALKESLKKTRLHYCEVMQRYQQEEFDWADSPAKTARLKLRESQFNFFTKYGNARLQAEFVKIAKSDARFWRPFAEFNTNNWLLNCANGTLDLQTGKLRGFDRDDYLSHQVAIDYDPKAQHDEWDTFLVKFTGKSKELRAFVLQWLYYNLTGDTSAQLIAIWQGKPNSGKGTIARIMYALLGGTLAREAARGAFCHKEYDNVSHQDFLAQLKGRRFVVQSEFEDKKLDTGLIKQVSGQDRIYASAKGKSGEDYLPTYKLNLFSNLPPIFNVEDDAIGRRLRVISCNYVPTAEELADKDLEKRLHQELSGILANLVNEGRELFFEHRLLAPEDMKKRMAEIAEHQNPFREWLLSFYEVPAKEIIEKAAEAGYNSEKYPFKVKRSEINGAYAAYCKENGYKEIGRPRKIATLNKLGIEEVKSNGDFYFAPLQRQPKTSDEEESHF